MTTVADILGPRPTNKALTVADVLGPRPAEHSVWGGLNNAATAGVVRGFNELENLANQSVNTIGHAIEPVIPPVGRALERNAASVAPYISAEGERAAARQKLAHEQSPTGAVIGGLESGALTWPVDAAAHGNQVTQQALAGGENPVVANVKGLADTALGIGPALLLGGEGGALMKAGRAGVAQLVASLAQQKIAGQPLNYEEAAQQAGSMALLPLAPAVAVGALKGVARGGRAMLRHVPERSAPAQAGAQTVADVLGPPPEVQTLEPVSGEPRLEPFPQSPESSGQSEPSDISTAITDNEDPYQAQTAHWDALEKSRGNQTAVEQARHTLLARIADSRKPDEGIIATLVRVPDARATYNWLQTHDAKMPGHPLETAPEGNREVSAGTSGEETPPSEIVPAYLPPASHMPQVAESGRRQDDGPALPMSQPTTEQFDAGFENVRGSAAIDKALATHSDVHDAMQRPGIGSIAFLWGDAKGGIAHVLNEHGEKVVRAIPDVIAHGRIGETYSTGRGRLRRRITLGGKTVVLSPEYEGRDLNWVVTGFEEGKASGDAATTHVPQSSATHGEVTVSPDMGAEAPESPSRVLSGESIPNPQDDEPSPGRQRMQAGANYVGLTAEHAVPETTAPPGKPITRQDVLRPFLKALGVRLYEGRVKGAGTLGFYIPKKEAVRVKKKGDLEVAAHELAHLIDDRTPEISRAWRPDQQKAAVDKKAAATRRDELREVSYDHKNVKEGFAEFVRLWMTQPEEAQRRAPSFNAWFNDFAQRSEYGPALRQARESMQDWYHQSDLQRAKSKIGVTKPINAALDGLWDRFRQSVADDLHGIYRMERELRSGRVEHGGAYETARLTRAAYTIAERAFLDGAPKKMPDGTTRFEGNGLQQILEPVAGDLDNWLLYAVGRSAAELKMQGRENLFTVTEIRAMRALETPEFRRSFDEYQAWNKAVVDFAQAHGIINPSTRQLWQRAQYLPMYRADQRFGGRRAKGIEGNWNGIHRLTGGTGNLNDMLGNIMQNAARLIVDAIKNEARQDIAALADTQRGGGRFMVKIPRDAKPIGVDKEQIRSFVYDMLGLRKADVDGGNVPPEVADQVRALERQFAEHPDFLQFWMFGQAPKGDNVVAVMRGGKPDFYEVADPILYRAISALNRPARHWLVTVLSYPKRIGQASVTLTIDFMMRNIARDTLMAGIMSHHGFRPIYDSLSGMKSRIMRDASYQEALANGIGISSMLRDETAFRKHLTRFYAKNKINPKFVLDAPDKIVYALETIAEAFETSTRFGEYKRARAKGMNPKEAAYQSREISTDFAMRGDSQVLGFLYDTVMFLKPMVNSMDRLYRGLAHDEQRFHIAAKVGILATVSAGLYLHNRTIPQYQDLPDWDKDTYWHIYVPDGKGGNLHFRFPKLWEIGAISSLAERTTEHLVEEHPDHPLWMDSARIVGNLFYVNGIPQVAAPLYEIATNRDSFTGVPIENESSQSLATWARTSTYTPQTLVKIGQLERNLPRALEVSPDKLDALCRGYFNTWCSYALSISDAAFFDDKPNMRVDEYPVIKSFYEGSPARSSKYVQKFYDLLQQTTEARRTFTAMAKTGEAGIAGELARTPEQGEYSVLNDFNTEIRKIDNAMKLVRESNKPPAQKRHDLDKYTTLRNTLMKEAVQAVAAAKNANGG